jgi:murein DD-endopeptidase MepM/ murein hydrolase activator NlpD
MDRLFVPREVFLRADGRVRYLKISRRQQMAAAAAVTALAGWTLASTAGLVAGAFFVESKNARLHEASVAYDRLRQQLTASQQRFAELAQTLREQRALAFELVGGAAQAAELLASADAAAAMPSYARTDPVRQTVSETTARLATLAADKLALERDLEKARRDFAGLADERKRSTLARDQYAFAWLSSEAELQAQQGRNATLSAEIARLRAQLGAMKFAATDRDEARLALDRRIVELSERLAAATSENRQLSQAVTGMQRTMALIADDRNALRAARNDLSAQVAFLEGRMSTLQATQHSIVQRLTERTQMTVAEIEKTVLMTGLDLETLLGSATGKLSGEGGPFVPAVRAVRTAEEHKLLASIQKLDGEVDRWGRLQMVVRTLPLAAPLDSYTIVSGFGERTDPIVGKRAVHAGVDLKNKLGTPVLATAPGTVIYAGWMRDYGRIVEIDHGLGIRTRYAHLKSISVKVGQTVEFRQQIGKLGNSGRSTGPHLHYEVQVNGKPFDPMNFLEAGKYVFKG